MTLKSTKRFVLLAMLVAISPLNGFIIYDNFGGSPQQYSVGTAEVSEITLDGVLVLPSATGGMGVSNPVSFLGRNYFQLITGSFAVVSLDAVDYLRTLSVGQTWTDLGGVTSSSFGNISAIEQSDGTGRYLKGASTYVPFVFNNTNEGNILNYGYVNLSTSIVGSGVSAELQLTIIEYAYEDDGAQITMGAVPEPSTIAALLGMLAVGVVLIRRFRR